MPVRSVNRTALLVACFTQSAAVILLMRGVYFYTKDVLDFSIAANLWLGLLLGLTYVCGAVASHRAARWIGEKRLALLVLALHLAVAVVATRHPTPVVMWVLYPMIGLLIGLFWPVVESYVTAGLTGCAMLKAVGRFCIAWAVAVPLAIAVSGPLIDTSWPASIFALTGLCHAVTATLFWPQPLRPAHTPGDHPELPDPARSVRYRTLLAASRWCMMSSSGLLFLLSPLLPAILTGRLGLSNTQATPLASLMDWARVAAFGGLMAMTFWYSRVAPVALCAVTLPAGFAAVLFGPTLVWVVAGELMFGLSTGIVYYAALYYALAIKNAAVEAGGGHEALVGGGFVLGPAGGLIGMGLAGAMHSPVAGMLIGAAPLIAVCLLGGTVPLIRGLGSAPAAVVVPKAVAGSERDFD